MDEHTNSSPALIARGGSQSDLRRHNERVVLSAIRLYPGMFNAELARRTGLAAQTISVILRSLDSHGLIRRGPVLRGRRGQPATPVYLNPEGAYSIGCEIGWRHVGVLGIDFEGRVLAEDIQTYPYPDPATVFSTLADMIERLMEKMPPKARDTGMRVGIAMPSYIHENLHHFGAPEHVINAWRETDPTAEMRSRLDCPVWVINDGTAACRAENTFGHHVLEANFAYLFIGAFVGAGIVLDGKVFDGPTGNAGNLGSMMVTGRDGKRVVPHFVSSLHRLRNMLDAKGHQPQPVTNGGLAWTDQDDLVDEWLDEAAHILAQVVVNTCATIEFDRIIVDGSMPGEVLDDLIARIDRELDVLPITAFDRPKIDRGQIGLRAAALGAAGVPLYYQFFADEGVA